MKKILIAIIFLATMLISAQDFKFGKVSKAELEEKFYPLDSTVDAAYLYKKRRDYYDYSNNEGFQLITEVVQRIKIYKKDGFDYATKLITYYSPDRGEKETVSSIKGYTYNLVDGKVSKEKVSKKDIFKEKVNKYRKQVKITMPNIKIGTVIEIKYTKRSPYTTTIEDLQFQYNIPVKKIDYTVEVPEIFVFTRKIKGYYMIKPIDTKKSSLINNSKSYSTSIYKYKANNIPALKDNEPYVTDIYNYRGGIKFELTSTNYMTFGGGLKYYSTTWEDVSKQIFKSLSFGNELDKSNYYKKDLEPLLSEAKTDFDKIAIIFQHVKSKVKWNNFIGKYTDKGVKKAYKEGVGNSADINLMLTSMLRFAGLDANPVLVSTRANGVPLFPTLKGFNYVISMVEFNGGYVLLDATEPYSLPNVLPTRVLNWNGRKVTKSGASSWVQLTSSLLAIEDDNVNVKITEDLEIEGLLRSKYENLNALNYRRKNNHIKDENIKLKLEERFNIEIENFKIVNQNKISQPISVMAKFSSEDLIEEINNKLYISPLLFYAQKTNPFKLEERKFPVDFSTPWKDKHSVSIQMPDGYKVESLPAPMAIGLPDNLGVFKYQVRQVGSKIITVSILQFNSAMIGAENYKILKLFYGDLVKKQSEKIVLVKQ